MVEQITYYHDEHRLSPFCHSVEIALVEAGASYTSHGFDIHNKPAWFAQVNPQTGKVRDEIRRPQCGRTAQMSRAGCIPAITYGGPEVPPEEPSALSFKLTESLVILEFLADLFPNSSLLPPASNPTARARVRFFIDVVARDVATSAFEFGRGAAEALEKLIEGMEKMQMLLPDPDAAGGGEYAIGKDFTNADCAIVPLLASLDILAKTDLGKFEPGMGTKLGETLAGQKFDRLRRYKKALFERESVKKVIDLECMEATWRVALARK